MKNEFQGALAAGIGALTLLANAAQADQVIADDLIVQQSLCVGQDCVNGENFGFDTIRMKENNTRIKFQDTSNSGSFPTVDWQLTANESTNGGLNKFSIESIDNGRVPFTVEYGAPSNSLYVDDGGRLGLGTATPVVELQVVDGDSPTLRLEQDGSSGFTAQTWDVAGNETNFFVRDATNGSRIPFKIRPSAPTNAFYIDTDGDIGVATASPAAQLDVRGSADQTALSVLGNASGVALSVMGGATGQALKVVSGGSTELASFEGTGTQLMYLESTDGGAAQLRIKSNGENRRIIGMTNGGTIQSQMVLGTDEIRLAGATDTGTNLWARINASGIFTQGPSCDPGPCDRTFDASYFTPPSIEEHAEFMWENSYLWGVGPTSPGLSFNLTEKSAGMLHELEIAHIYIEQLHNRLNALEEQVLTK